MIDEDKLSQAAAKAVRAQNLLDNELLKEAFDGLKTQYSGDLLKTTVDQASARERLYLAYRVVIEVERHLANIVNNGKLAAAELKELAETAERRRKFGTLT